MRKGLFSWMRCTAAGWALAVVVLAAVPPMGAMAAERIVLGEEFTANW